MPGIVRAREAGGLTQGTRGLIQNEITAGSRQFHAKLFCMPWKDETVQVEVEQTYFVSTKAGRVCILTTASCMIRLTECESVVRAAAGRLLR
jgi:hypothetical protein